jgi:2-dehydro-3-deoxyphosphogluconate aldolase/(4S)-4-hydroxy-2-oxoglutarate aldolase
MKPVATRIVDTLREFRIVPIITIDDATKAVPLADALAAGGLPVLEVTFRTAEGAEAIRRIADERPHLVVGAGTVLTTRQAAEAKAAGARFALSPGLNRSVVAWCQEHDLPIFPGVCTPTDIEMALEQGLTAVKIFPIEPVGGLAYLRAVSAPFPGLAFLPTGGVSASNVADYLAFEKVIACGGSWMTSPAWIAAGAFDRVQQAAAAAAAVARPAPASR